MVFPFSRESHGSHFHAHLYCLAFSRRPCTYKYSQQNRCLIIFDNTSNNFLAIIIVGGIIKRHQCRLYYDVLSKRCLSVCLLYSCMRLKPLDGMKCYLTETACDPKYHRVRQGPVPREPGKFAGVGPTVNICIASETDV